MQQKRKVMRFHEVENAYNKYKLNEGKITDFLMSTFSRIGNLIMQPLKKVGKYFVGKNSWLYNMVIMEENGALAKLGIRLYNFPNVNIPNLNNESEEMDDELEDEEMIENNNSYDIEDIDEGNRIPLEYPTTNVPDLNVKELVDFIKISFKTKKPVYVWGAPGIGKTQIIEKIADDLNVPVIFVELNIKNATDFSGVPEMVIDAYGEKRTKFILPEFFPSMQQNHMEGRNPGGIMFVDEANRANTGVLNACLQLVGSRRLESYEFPPAWIIIGAGNRPDEVGASGSNFDVAMGGRWEHINFVPSFEEWKEWGIKPSSDPLFKDRDFKNVPDDILTFVEHMDEYFYNLDDDNINKPENQLYGSPRNWARAGVGYQEVMKYAQEEGKTYYDVRRMIELKVSANVGVPTARAFLEYMDLVNVVDFSKLKLAYTDPKNAPDMPKQRKKDPKTGRITNEELNSYNPAVVYAIQNHVLNLKKGQDITIKEAGNLVEWIMRIKSHPDYIAAFLRKIREVFPSVADNKSEEIVAFWREVLSNFEKTQGKKMSKL